MTTKEPIEARLQRLLEIDPTDDALASLRRRVSRVAAEPAANNSSRHQRLRLLLRPLPLGAAFLLLAGTVAGSLGLLERTATESGDGWRQAWERAEVLGLDQTDAGYKVTLERAYADINQVVVFLNVAGPLNGEQGGSVDLDISLIDAAGNRREQLGIGAIQPDLAAVIRAWDSPAREEGTYVLEVTSLQVIPGAEGTDPPAPIEGEWRFEFSLPDPQGVAITPDASVTNGAATVTLTEVRLSPSMIRGVMYLTIEGAPAAVWSPVIASISHDGELVSTDTNANFYGTPIREEQATGFDFRTGFGAAVTSGSWEITISQIDFPELVPSSDRTADADHPYAPLHGPWVLNFSVP